MLAFNLAFVGIPCGEIHIQMLGGRAKGQGIVQHFELRWKPEFTFEEMKERIRALLRENAAEVTAVGGIAPADATGYIETIQLALEAAEQEFDGFAVQEQEAVPEVVLKGSDDGRHY